MKLPVKCSLLSGTVLPSLPLLRCLDLAVRELLDAESASGLVVTMSRALDVLDWIDAIGLSVDVVYEVIGHTLVGGAQKPGTAKLSTQLNYTCSKFSCSDTRATKSRLWYSSLTADNGQRFLSNKGQNKEVPSIETASDIYQVACSIMLSQGHPLPFIDLEFKIEGMIRRSNFTLSRWEREGMNISKNKLRHTYTQLFRQLFLLVRLRSESNTV